MQSCTYSCLYGHLPRLSFDVVLDLFAVLQLLLQLLNCVLHSISGKSHALPLFLRHTIAICHTMQQRIPGSC